MPDFNLECYRLHRDVFIDTSRAASCAQRCCLNDVHTRFQLRLLQSPMQCVPWHDMCRITRAAVAASCVAAALALAVLAVLARRFLTARKRTGAEGGPPSKYALRGLRGAPPGGGSRASSGVLDRTGSTTPPTPVASTAGGRPCTLCLGSLF